MMENKRNSSLPALFESHVFNIFLGGAMMPLRQIRIAVRIFRWSLDLDSIDTSFAFQPKKFKIEWVYTLENRAERKRNN